MAARAALRQLHQRPDLVRAESSRLGRARDRADHAKRGHGLVPSINNVETLKVEHLQARCTRLRKNLGVAAKQLQADGGVAFMLTFTYSDGVEWQPSHVRAALDNLRAWMKRTYGRALRYIWVLETTDRKSGLRKGEFRPHYHCVVWVPASVTAADLRFDARGWWPHGMTNAVQAVAPVKYVMKYASKFENGSHFPRGARVYGIGGLDSVGRQCRRWINWPRFVQARASHACPWRRAVGGGWTAPDGQHWAAEWALAGIGKGYSRIRRVHDHGPGLFGDVHPDGPWSLVRLDNFAGGERSSL